MENKTQKDTRRILKSRSIDEFFEGERILRIEPRRWPIRFEKDKLTGESVPVEWGEDHTLYTAKNDSYRFFIYQGISEGKIYLLEKSERGEFLWDLDYEDWKNGWARYVDPETLSLLDEDNLLKEDDAKKYLEKLVRDDYMN